MNIDKRILLVLVSLAALACSGDDDGDGGRAGARIYDFANGCYTARDLSAGFIEMRGPEEGYSFEGAEPSSAEPFFMKASGLGHYLFYDSGRGYLVGEEGGATRALELAVDGDPLDDGSNSEAVWELISPPGASNFYLRHVQLGRFLAAGELVSTMESASLINLEAASGCAEFPEEGIHSEGEVEPLVYDDGSVFGFADTHSHIFANFGFGGGGIFHGAPYHPLGVERALPSCEPFHGPDGRADLFGAGFDGTIQLDVASLVTIVQEGLLTDFNHVTDGYPEFTTWPSAFDSSTHQTQYYKWIERAYRSGLRLVVQHAVSNQIICDFLGRGGIQPIRYSCNDMVAVDRQIDEAYLMQDYIDAQEGGPGKGWFRVVTTPADAREVILDGKMAVVLGIETSNLFDCFLSPPTGFARCTEQDVIDRLSEYYDRGVRVLFPNHKYDNAFTAGDGSKDFIEIGNIIQTGHFSNFVTECDESVSTTFDRGPMAFPGLNEVRDDFLAVPPNDFTEFFLDPIAALSPFIERFLVPPLPGIDNHCQNHGLTELGEFLIDQIMKKGMILEIDHLPRLSYRRAIEMLQENDYPAVGTHGQDAGGVIYALGGTSKSGFGVCRAEDEVATVDNGYQNRLQRIVDNGGFPGLGFGFDLNGFAGAPRPRFGERSRCSTLQTDPLTYPFTSYAGDITFTEPKVGNRAIDFNTDGFVHIGMVPELIEDVRRDGVSDEDLEPLFKSAEAYIRVWERSQRRAAELREE